MLDFTKLTTPRGDGDVLVLPEPKSLPIALRKNADSLSRAETPLLQSTLAEWRRQTREAMTGSADRPIIVTGHQPAFIHPGVWSKHVVASRLAAATGGVAINLVVDSDQAKQASLAIPVADQGRVALVSIPFARTSAGHAFEQLQPLSPDRLARIAREVAEAMGDRYAKSMMPGFLEALAAGAEGDDWVGRMVSARQAVESSFGVALEEHRVSAIWCTPLLGDMLVNAPEFGESYNAALKTYRRDNRVRGVGRPIPDLVTHADRWEVPVWAYRADGPRRRLFVTRSGDSLRLFADDEEIGLVSISRLADCGHIRAGVEDVDGWRLRPRALTLTIWARLLLADLFIHGIGGAKYDRISDAIMADYYGVEPPHMACVSATLRLGKLGGETTGPSVHDMRRSMRDLQFNPQRNLPAGPDLAALIQRRAHAVCRSVELRDREPSNRSRRREVFTEIRRINSAMLAMRTDAERSRKAELDRALEGLSRRTIARGREYFFALHDIRRLEQLTQALPDRSDFGL